MSSTELAVSHWREHRFRVSDLPFEAAVRSLNSATPWVELRRASEYEWVVGTIHIARAYLILIVVVP